MSEETISSSDDATEEVAIDLDVETDPRVIWFKQRILSVIGLDDDELFYNMLKIDNAKEKLKTFILSPLKPNELTLDKRTFYVSKIMADKLIYEDKEFTEWRIIPPPPPPPPSPPKKKGKKGEKVKPPGKAPKKPPPQSPPSEDDPISVEGSEILTAVTSEVIEASKTDLSQSALPTKKSDIDMTDFEDYPLVVEDSYTFPPPPENLDPEVDGVLEFYTVTRPVPRVIRYPKLIPVFGAFTPMTTIRNRRYIYFVRVTQQTIPLEESAEITMLKMPEYVLTGMLNGKILTSLGTQLKESFIPLFENQFREATALATDSNHDVLGKDSSFAGVHYKMEETTSQVNYLRPSDYRRMSNVARGENAEKRMKNMHSESYVSVVTARSLMPQQSFSKFVEQHADDEADKKTAGEEVINDINNLIGMVQWTIEHIEGEIHLPMPSIPALQEEGHRHRVDIVDTAVFQQMEAAVMMWQAHIETTIQACLGKTRDGAGPVAEYKYWRERDAEISILVEQLKQPMVVKILSLLERNKSSYSEGFLHYKERLIDQYNLAGDNLKFLSTLMRYFVIMEDDSPLKAVIDMLPEMVESIYMMWVLSKGYRSDDTMVPLMARISYALCAKCERVLNVHKLFDKSNEEVLSLTRSGQKIMELWHQLYRDTRRSIELSGKGARWEFDQPLLFTRTDYIGRVAKDLGDVITVLIDFERIFGNELKSIIADPTQIDDVRKRVKNLVFPIRTVDFSVYVYDNQENWEAIMDEFWIEVRYLEEEAKNYINQSFGNLRSSEEALSVLLKFLEFDARDSIKKQLSTKFELVMRQFIKEITSVEDKFNRYKKNPPLLRYHPPVAGSIYWARALLNKIKQSVIKFQKVPELNKCEPKKEAFVIYKKFAKVVKEYEESKFNEWVDNASKFVDNMMKKNLLKVAFKKEKGKRV